ncbi:hypothetical protein AM499_17360 [Bacillus sp. FJAT-22090]|uniref:hypothetical protein n=1 Tax=Bacillus sp. FJAT-22090 TaxID=1581038 RepID=UPI0006AFDEAA|nr:hypothetical protein [Bacillus sp. FJAT-22090]ALC87384.1 hypothetical protein AM499_17360 [Bacillus sp. FJAT-22090]
MLMLLIFASGCSSNTPTNPYTGRVLNIGIIGNSPTIIENKTVKFVPITFEDLANDNYKNYDAVFIMKEKLAEASNDNYSKVYAELQKPIIFIGTDTLTPFISDAMEYHPKDFQKGSSFSSGLIEGSRYGFGLYNDRENEASLKLFYSDLFRLIE